MEEKDLRQWCMFMHLSQFAGYLVPLAGILAPIIMWQTKKDESPEIDAHGRMIVNAMLSYFIYWIVAIASLLILIGFVLIPILAIASIALPIIGAIKANEGVLWRYPFVFSFL